MKKAKTEPFKHRKMPTQARAKATWNTILDAATQVLLSKGYVKTTTNHIADRAGLSIGTIYEYFPDKASIIAAIQLRWNEHRWSIMKSSIEKEEMTCLQDCLKATVSGSIAATRCNPQLNTALTWDVPFDITRAQRDRMQEDFLSYSLIMLRKFKSEVRRSDFKLTARLVMHATHAIVEKMAAIDPEYLESKTFEAEVIDMMSRYMVKDNSASLSRGLQE